jgi:hypothetical protein
MGAGFSCGKFVVRASPTRELNKEPNVKNYTFSFCFFISSLQRVRQTNSYFSYLLREESFLHFTVEMAKTNNCWPTVIFIVIDQLIFSLQCVRQTVSQYTSVCMTQFFYIFIYSIHVKVYCYCLTFQLLLSDFELLLFDFELLLSNFQLLLSDFEVLLFDFPTVTV